MFRRFVLKSGIETLFIPITLIVIRFIKNREHLDIIDVNTRFNIFSLDVEYGQDNNKYVAKKPYAKN